MRPDASLKRLAQVMIDLPSGSAVGVGGASSRQPVGVRMRGAGSAASSGSGRATTVMGSASTGASTTGSRSRGCRRWCDSRMAATRKAPRMTVFVAFHAVASVKTPFSASRHTPTTVVRARKTKNRICGIA